MQRFVRWCVVVAVLLAIAGLSGWLVGGLLLGGLVLLMAGLVALVAEEERQFELREAALGHGEPAPSPADVTAPGPLAAAPSEEPAASVPDRPAPQPSGVVTVFRLPATVPAERVCVVGDFNDWSHSADPMALEGDTWVARRTLQPGRAYRFRYLLDGERWENDWSADAYVPNEFGGEDSVVDLSGWPAALVGAVRGLGTP